jgi:hypothetical protein
MTSKKLTDLTELTTLHDDDWLYLVDISDITDSVAGTSVKVRAKNARGTPQTTAEFNQSITPTNYQYNPGDTQRYTNGLADALLVAADAAAGEEKDIYFSASEALGAGDEITIPAGTDGISVTSAPGTEITYTGTGTAVTIGGTGDQIFRVRWDVKIRKTNQAWDDGTDTTSIGLRCAGVKYGEVYADVEGFNWGLALYSLSGDGNVHSEYFIKLLQDNRQQLVIDRDTGGWNNSNTFKRGLITWRSGTVTTAISNTITLKHILQNHVSDNGNLFEEISLELVASSALTAASCVVEVNGQWNRFLQCRIEVSDQYTDQVIIGASALYNYLDFGRISDGLTHGEFLNDGSDGSNSTLWNRNEAQWGAYRRHKCGAIQASGRPTGARYDGDFAANVVAGPNSVSAANKVFAALDGSSNVVAGITGTGRFAVGKDPVANLGFFQFKDPDGTDDTESVNFATFEDTTTDATASNTNFDSVTIPQNSTTFVEIDFVMRYADGTKVWTQKRTGCISKDGASAAVLETDTALVTHDPDTFTGSAEIRVASDQLQARVTGVAATTIEWTGFIKWQSVIAAS